MHDCGKRWDRPPKCKWGLGQKSNSLWKNKGMSLALPSLCTEHDIVMLGRTGRQRQPAGPAFCSVSDPAVSFYSPSVGPQRDGTMAPHHRENLNSGLLTLGSILPLKIVCALLLPKAVERERYALGQNAPEHRSWAIPPSTPAAGHTPVHPHRWVREVFPAELTSITCGSAL